MLYVAIIYCMLSLFIFFCFVSEPKDVGLYIPEHKSNQQTTDENSEFIDLDRDQGENPEDRLIDQDESINQRVAIPMDEDDNF